MSSQPVNNISSHRRPNYSNEDIIDDLNMYDEEEIGLNPHEQHEDQEFSNDEPIEGGALPHDNYSSQMLDVGAGESLMQSMGEENMIYGEEEEEDYIEAGEQRINT